MANLFKDAEDLQSVLPNMHVSADDVLKYITDAEELYMVDYLSAAFYAELLSALDSADYVLTDLTASQQAIIHHLRTASAYYGMYDALPYINVNISNAGAMAMQGEGIGQLRQWEFNKAQANSIQKADRFMDKALAVMETTPDNYSTWKSSSAFTSHKKYLLTNADDFASKGLISIGGSRRTFFKLLPFINKAELNYITPCIGETIFDDVKSKLLAGTALESYQTTLLTNFIYPAVAHYAVFLGAPNLKLDISQDGIRLVSTNDGITGLQPDDRSYKEWLAGVHTDAQNYLNRAKQYLDKNSATITDYENDDASSNGTPQYNIPTNTSTSSVMI